VLSYGSSAVRFLPRQGKRTLLSLAGLLGGGTLSPSSRFAMLSEQSLDTDGHVPRVNLQNINRNSSLKQDTLNNYP